MKFNSKKIKNLIISFGFAFLFSLLFFTSAKAEVMDFKNAINTVSGFNDYHYYVGQNEAGRKYITVDSKKYGPYDETSTFKLINKEWAFSYKLGNQYYVQSSNGKIGPMSDADVDSFQYGGFGLGWISKKDKLHYMNIEGKIYGPCESDRFVYVKQNKWVYACLNKETMTVYTDGGKSRKFSNAGNILVSAITIMADENDWIYQYEHKLGQDSNSDVEAGLVMANKEIKFNLKEYQDKGYKLDAFEKGKYILSYQGILYRDDGYDKVRYVDIGTNKILAGYFNDRNIYIKNGIIAVVLNDGQHDAYVNVDKKKFGPFAEVADFYFNSLSDYGFLFTEKNSESVKLNRNGVISNLGDKLKIDNYILTNKLLASYDFNKETQAVVYKIGDKSYGPYVLYPFVIDEKLEDDIDISTIIDYSLRINGANWWFISSYNEDGGATLKMNYNKIKVVVVTDVSEAKIIVQSGKTIDVIITHVNKTKDVKAQKDAMDKYTNVMTKGYKLTQAEIYSINNFIVYGTKSTLKLSIAKRADLVKKYKTNYKSLPKTEGDWGKLLKLNK